MYPTLFSGVSESPRGRKVVGGLEDVLFFHMLGIIIPTDFHIFQMGRYTTNQIYPCIRPMFQGYVSGNTSSKDAEKWWLRRLEVAHLCL